MKKIALLFFVILLQVFIFSRLKIIGIALDISLLIFVFTCWNLEDKILFRTALLCGLLTDVLTSDSFPKYIIVFVGAALLIKYLRQYMGSRYNRWKLAVFVLSLVILNLVTIIFGAIQLTSIVLVVVCTHILFNSIFAGIITMALPKKV